MRGLPFLMARAYGQPWAIYEPFGWAIDRVLQRRASGAKLSAEEIEAAVGDSKQARDERRAALEQTQSKARQVRILPVWGTVLHRSYELADVSSGGLMSMEWLDGKIREALADPSVGSVVLDIDSPGGTIGGVPEVGALIASAEKPIVAVANSMAASAAYWLGSQAHEFVVTPSGMVGSIGVWILHQDRSKSYEMEGVTNTVIRSPEFKAEMLPYGPLTAEAKAHLEALVTKSRKEFESAVAKGRGVTPAKVRDDFGQGRMMEAQEALGAGLVDRVATLQETVERLAAGGRVKRRGGSRAEEPESVTLLEPPSVEETHESSLELEAEEFRFKHWRG